MRQLLRDALTVALVGLALAIALSEPQPTPGHLQGVTSVHRVR